MTKSFVFQYADEKEMWSFVNDNWDRVSSVSHVDDFDGHYWLVLILPPQPKQNLSIGDILKGAN